ncbi:cytochrome c biogenesis protein CcsA [Cyclobacterium amurskyense]|jgi:heme exporter protein C|uniref:Cytochrome c-type biogenesis protein CcmC, putative heme lyase for CcmE n=1 Tax=Cyclobacterium amurskyense TaxID=320787 RepID=A0A0H4PFB9_9BACT|nr:cytochrome c biogenesis protein CcsA [Cyclobacterium amurskyense]AKP51770.1 Cytochrome c-type biogenesis protein CcmC, putative heme lyase for CcmE [Cyclobacterium amurskyense]|tara:strand:+ start:8507 stop:9181 length:675 start_codon:yes stop_codon:yes gene_type:complete
MKAYWWKILAILLLAYTIIAGLLIDVPRLPILNETIRGLFFHVTMWFGMLIMLVVAVVYGVRHLRTGSLADDDMAVEFTNGAILFGVIGITTGMVWAKFTWGDFWTNDPKLNASAIGLLMYFAYLVLRNSLTDVYQRAKISAVYSIFAFAVFIPLIFILPRLTDSLHPGNGGNPGFNAYDMDSNLRTVFYPAIIGWTLLGTWIATVRVRLRRLERKLEDKLINQ